MNVVIPLTDLEAERLTDKATRVGLTLVEYLRRLATDKARPKRHEGRVDTIAVKVAHWYAEGLNDTQIAAVIHVSPSTVASKRVALRLPAHPAFGRQPKTTKENPDG